MDLKVILDATADHMKEPLIKHVHQRRLRDNLCISVRRNDSPCTALRTREKYPLHVESM